MWLHLFRRPQRKARRLAPAPRFRPTLEALEQREVLSSPGSLHAPALAPALVAPAASANANITITDVNLTNIQIVNGALQAAGTVSGTLAGLPFTTQIANFTLQAVSDDPTTQQTECSVLHLELAPIHLSLLGLHVDTSAICLNITATEGGGLLGDLLCNLSGASVLGTLPTLGQLGDLQGGLTDLLNGSLQNLQSSQASDNSICTGKCHILELSVGPLNLSLLGLNVALDDCAGGPVLVCVSATRSEGLLGSLLCSLAGPRLSGLSINDLTQLVNKALDLLSDGDLSRADIRELRSLFRELLG